MKRKCNASIDTSLFNEELNFSYEIEKIKQIFSKFDRSKLIRVSEAIQSLLKKDFLADLPYDVSMRILSHVNFKDLLVCSTVSQRWNELCNDDYLWRNLCIEENIKCPQLYKPPKSSWKSLYMMEKSIELNWRNGSIWSPIVMNAHPKHVITCLEIYKDWIISGSDDSGICIWDINKGICIFRLYGHLGGVWSILVLPPLSKNKKRIDYYPLLVSGSTDRTARVWCLDNEKWHCTSVMFGHESTVRCMSSNSSNYIHNDDLFNDQDEEESIYQQNLLVNSKIQEQCQQLHGHSCYTKKTDKFDNLLKLNGDDLNCRLICTGSRDASIRIWNAYTGECLNKLYGHRGAVRCVQFVGCHVISGSYDCRIKIWCCRTGECLFTLSDHINRIYTLWFDGTTIISGSFDTSMKIWKLEQIKEDTLSQPALISREDSNYQSQHAQQEASFSVSQNSTDGIRNGNLRVIRFHTFCGYLSLTSEMIIDSGQLITSNTDKTIRVWRLNNATCEQILAGPNQHNSSVSSVQVIKNFIISSSNNGVVKLWCRKTGKFIRDIIHLDSAFHGGLIWKILATKSALVCAAGCPLGAEDTKIIVIHFDNGYDIEKLDQDQLNSALLNKLNLKIHSKTSGINGGLSSSDSTSSDDVRLSSLVTNHPPRPGLARSSEETDTTSIVDDESESEISWLFESHSNSQVKMRVRNSLESVASSDSIPRPRNRVYNSQLNAVINDDFSLFDSEDI